MKRFLRIGIFAVMISLLPARLFAQDMQLWDPNLTLMSAKPTLSDVGQFPEEGILPWNAPCTDCEEDMSKRTLSERYFTKGSEFYVQKSFGSLHYSDESGRLITIDPRLREVSSGRYEAPQQSSPTFIDVGYGSGIVLPDGQRFLLNHELVLYEYTGGVRVKIADADWSTYTVGDNGMHVDNIFPSIDLIIVVNQGEIESDFIIKEELEYGSLVIEDSPLIPLGWNTTSDGSESLILHKPGEETGVEIFRPVIFDQSGIRSSYLTDYEITDGKFRIYIDSSYLHDPSRMYPVVVDPLVTSTATYGAGSMEFKYDGSFCAGLNPDCMYNLSVPLPPSVTLTSATLTAEYRTVAGGCALVCWMSDAGFFITGPCANYPAGLWLSCISPGGDAIGTCSGAGINIFSTVSCLAPLCSGNINFTINNSYCWCSNNGTDCTGSLPCQRMNNNTWVITLAGHNLETLGDVIDGNGNQTVNADCCDPALLDPAPDFGVPPYTYLWGGFGGGGSVSPDTTVFSCADGLWTYTCQVTDACGVVRTATFDLVVDDCGALPVELIDFVGVWNKAAGYVELTWNTESEINNEKFLIYHSLDAKNWNYLDSKSGGGSSSAPKSYSYEDSKARRGLNYYKLCQKDYGGTEKDLSIIAVYVDAGTAMEIYPNPATGTLTVETNMPSSYISITDVTGRPVLPIVPAESTQNIDLSLLSPGIYFVLVMNERSREIRRLIIN